MNQRTIKANVMFSILHQIVSIGCGFIIPRVLLKTFGSNTNGLISSISQFLNYVTLLEGGVAGVATAALYKPLHENDKDRVNDVVNAIRRYFNRLGLLCIAFTVIVAMVYPRFVNTKHSYSYVFLLTLVLGSRLIIQYCVSISYRLLLNADQKVYYASIVYIIISIVHLVLVLVCVKFTDDVLLVYFISGLIYLIQPLFYIVYVNKHYELDRKAEYKSDVLEQKWDGFGHNLAYYIHNNTDIVLLTLFSTFANISIYSIYLLVANALKGFIITTSSAVAPSIGNILADENTEKSNYYFEKYEFAIVLISFLFYTCGIELVVPFVVVYTKGVRDANYIQPIFGTILLLAEMIYCIRDPYISVAYASGHFRQTSKYAYGEAIGNIIVSILLVQKMGLVGVAIGTFVSMSVRAMQQVFYLRNNILFRDSIFFIKKILIYGSVSFIMITIVRMIIPYKMESFIQWIGYAFPAFIVTAVAFTIVNYIFYRREFTDLIRRIINK